METRAKVNLFDMTVSNDGGKTWKPLLTLCDPYIPHMDIGIDQMGASEETKEGKPGIPAVKKIITQGIATVVFWEDGTKTVVKRADDEPDSVYAAFTAALAIKCYGSNSAVKRIVGGAKEKKTKRKQRNMSSDELYEAAKRAIREMFGQKVSGNEAD